MSNSKPFSTKNICIISVFVAVITICSWISIPFGTIPITLQTLGILTTAGLLGLRNGTITVTVYLLLGIIGVPVFSGFGSGITKFIPYSETGATGGYLIGFIFIALIVGIFDIFIKKSNKRITKLLLLPTGMILGDIVCFACGTIWFVYFNPWKMGWMSTLSVCVIPFIIPDLIKIIIATILVNNLKHHTNL